MAWPELQPACARVYQALPFPSWRGGWHPGGLEHGTVRNPPAWVWLGVARDGAGVLAPLVLLKKYNAKNRTSAVNTASSQV